MASWYIYVITDHEIYYWYKPYIVIVMYIYAYIYINVNNNNNCIGIGIMLEPILYSQTY